MSGRNIFCGKWSALIWALGLAVLWSAAGQAISSQLKATVIDRYGNKHEVERLTFRGRLNIEYYVADQRRVVPLQEIDRMLFEGERTSEEQTIIVTLRTGRKETGTIMTGTNVTPHQDALGGGGGASGLSGSTPLGPFDIMLGDVREVIMRHPESMEPAEETILKATVIAVDGKLFEVRDLKYRGKLRLDYSIGSKRRFVDLEKVSRIEFAEGGFSQEQRPVTITYWSGKVVQGTVDVSTVRMAGETDKSFYERVNAAITGKMDAGIFSMGMHQLKQIRFHPADEDESQEESAEKGGAATEKEMEGEQEKE